MVAAAIYNISITCAVYASGPKGLDTSVATHGRRRRRAAAAEGVSLAFMVIVIISVFKG